MKYIYIYICIYIYIYIYINFTDVQYLPEDDQDRMKYVGLKLYGQKYNFNISAFVGFL